MSLAWEDDQLLKLLEVTRNFPPIWDIKHKEHRDKNIVDTCYLEVTEILRESVPDVNVAAVRQKIKNVSSQVQREMKRVRDSKKSGAGSEEVYKPKLWCWDEAKYLKETGDLRPTRSTLPDNSQNFEQNVIEETSTSSETAEESVVGASAGSDSGIVPALRASTAPAIPSSSADMTATQSGRTTLDSNETGVPRIAIERNRRPSVASRRFVPAGGPGLALLENAISYMNTPSPIKTDSELFGAMVGGELRLMTSPQRKRAKRRINDILAKGNDGELLSE